jgi:type I restriction enzyme S subunit
MAKKNKNPEVRFNGYSEDWEEKGLCEIAQINPKAELPESFQYVDLESVLGTEMTSHRSENKNTAPSRAQRLALKGDVFYQTVRPYQKNNYLFDKAENDFVFSTGYAQLRPFGDSYFLFSLVQGAKFVKIVMDNCTGTSYPAINATILGKIKINYPNPAEQKQIGSFFQNLDNLITLHQKKYDKLVILKKAMLVKMFPKNGAVVPEIRFKGFTEDWVEKKLGTTESYFTDGNYGEAYPSVNDLTDSGKGVPFLRGRNLSNGVLSKNGANYITYTKHSELTSGHLIEDDIVIAVRGSLGALGYVNNVNVGWNINSQLAIIRTNKEELKGNYLIQYLLSDFGQRVILSKSTGTALKQLPIGKLKEIVIPLTNIVEQQNIGQYFQNLDKQIALHQTQLDKLKNIKKACFTKIFVSQD